jgi:hypothetical protein
MTRTQRIITAALVLGSLILLILILAEGSSRPITVSKNNLSDQNQAANLSGTERIRLPRNPLGFSITDPSSDNLTQTLAFSVAQNILARDPSGPQLTEEEIAGQILGTPINFSFDSFLSEIATIKVATIPNPTEEDYQRYFDDIIKIVESYFTYLKVDISKLSRKDFQVLTDRLSATIAALLKVPAPADLAAFHEEQLKIISVQKKAFEHLTDFEIDPLKAVAAVQILEETNRRISTLWQSLPKIIEAES